MHSYALTNSELREKYLYEQESNFQHLILLRKRLSEESERPVSLPRKCTFHYINSKINLVDFVKYQCTPTLVYEINFPRR